MGNITKFAELSTWIVVASCCIWMQYVWKCSDSDRERVDKCDIVWDNVHQEAHDHRHDTDPDITTHWRKGDKI